MRARLTRILIIAVILALISAYALRAFRNSPRRSVQHKPSATETVTASPIPSSSSSSSSSPSSPSLPPQETSLTNPVPATSIAPISRPSAPPGPPDAKAMLAIDQVNLMIRDYRTMAGENPVGTNAEIMAAVMGDNPKNAKLGPPEGAQLNEKGELIDRWGTPYFFHQLSKTHMEIRSAGPDKVMWTADDPVVK